MGQRASDVEKRTCAAPFGAEYKPYERATVEITYFGKDDVMDVSGDRGETDPFSIGLD